MGVKKKVVVSISYFDFHFDTVPEACMFAALAAKTITDKSRGIEMNVKYIPDTDDVEDDEEEEE